MVILVLGNRLCHNQVNIELHLRIKCQKQRFIYIQTYYAPSPQRLLLCCQQQARAPWSRPPPCSTCPWPPPSATWVQPGGQAPPREPPAGPRRPGCHVQPSCAVMNNHKVVSNFSPSRLKVVPKSSQSCLKFISKFFPNRLKDAPLRPSCAVLNHHPLIPQKPPGNSMGESRKPFLRRLTFSNALIGMW